MTKTIRSLAAVIVLPFVGLALTLVVILVTLHSARADSVIIYVDADAPGPAHNGLSWTDAYTNVQDALAAAVYGDEIWVAEGVYYPDEGAGQIGDSIMATFQLTNGVALYGGFGGYGISETLRTQRDWAAHVTILSGDIDSNDWNTDTNHIAETWNDIQGSNAYHVVTGGGVTQTARLDGFTITAGNANGSTDYHFCGGGMYNDSSSPTLTNVTFSGNSASETGGGMDNFLSSPTLTTVTFSSNRANNSGGGMFNESSSPTLTDVIFSGNSANSVGGGMDNIQSSSPTLTNVTFNSNRGRHGGGMYNWISSPTLTNVTFSGNQATYDGGGMVNSSSNPMLTNVTFGGNQAGSYGGGMYNDSSSSPTLVNCILWGNAATGGSQIYNNSSNPTITYSDVQGGYAGVGNLDADPRFVTPPNGNLRLGPGSAAIDVGNDAVCPADDLDGISRPFGFGCDMGAYEMHTFSIAVDKSASDPTPASGQVVTLTIVVANTSPGLTGGLISDTLPAGMHFVGPLTLDPPEAGSVGSAPPTLAHSLVISANHTVTVTFPVSVAWGLAGGTAITNTALFTTPLLPAAESGSGVLVVANVAPEANDDTFIELENHTTSLDVLANDSDANGDSLIISIAGMPDQGGTVLNGGLVITYTPALNFVGTESFTYTVSDGYGGVATAWVTVTVANVNDPPAFTSTAVTTATEGVLYTYTVTAADPDLSHGDALTITAPTLPAWLLLTDHGDGTAALSGAPTNTDVGDHAVVLRVTDGDGLTATQEFTITVVEKPWYYIYLPLALRNAP